MLVGLRHLWKLPRVVEIWVHHLGSKLALDRHPVQWIVPYPPTGTSNICFASGGFLGRWCLRISPRVCVRVRVNLHDPMESCWRTREPVRTVFFRLQAKLQLIEVAILRPKAKLQIATICSCQLLKKDLMASLLNNNHQGLFASFCQCEKRKKEMSEKR